MIVSINIPTNRGSCSNLHQLINPLFCIVFVICIALCLINIIHMLNDIWMTLDDNDLFFFFQLKAAKILLHFSIGLSFSYWLIKVLLKALISLMLWSCLHFFFNLSILFKKYEFIYFNWRLITLQYCICSLFYIYIYIILDST